MVKDVKYTNLRDDIQVQAFLPYLAGRHFGDMTVYLRTSLDPKQLMSAVRHKVQQLDSKFRSTKCAQPKSKSIFRCERSAWSPACRPCSVARNAAGDDRSIWRNGVHGGTAHTRDRHSHSAWSDQGNVIWMVMREVLILIGLV